MAVKNGLVLVATPNGNQQEYYLNDVIHRTDGPAMITTDGTQIWFENGVLHCLTGPAIIQLDGAKEWVVNGIRMTEVEFNAL